MSSGREPRCQCCSVTTTPVDVDNGSVVVVVVVTRIVLLVVEVLVEVVEVVGATTARAVGRADEHPAATSNTQAAHLVIPTITAE